LRPLREGGHSLCAVKDRRACWVLPRHAHEQMG
jgi:hypothetical protein